MSTPQPTDPLSSSGLIYYFVIVIVIIFVFVININYPPTITNPNTLETIQP